MTKRRTGARIGLAAAATLLVASPAQAETTLVVELFTSQGCSSCPRADALLGRLKDRDGVVALTLNVDYWDYLGWKDDLALPENAKRQRAYAAAHSARRVYTPQMMLDGRMDVVGNQETQVLSAVETHLKDKDPAMVSVALSGDSVAATAPPCEQIEGEAVVWLVGYDASSPKTIRRGENAGRDIVYFNVVREWREIARWDGRAPLDLSAPRPKGDGGFAVIVQEGEFGPILGAAQHSY